MRLNYKKIGPHIRQVDIRNKEDKQGNLLGVSTRKVFIKSIANTVGTDFKKYKLVKKNQFTYVPDTSRRGDKMGLAMLGHLDEALVSSAYTVFEIIDHDDLDPEYLMMWFSRPEFNRYARFKSHGSVREMFDWEEMCDVALPMPHIDKQREIVREYNVIVDRIKLNEQLCTKLEDTAQALYKHWFVDFEFPHAKEVELVESGSKEIGEIPDGWSVEPLEKLCSKIASGATPRGGKASYTNSGTSLIRSMNIHDLAFKYKELAFINEEQSEKLGNVEVLDGDVLINITGASVARCSIAPDDVLPARVNQHVAIIRLKSDNVFPYYLTLYLISSNSKDRLLGTSTSGSTREALTKGDLEEFEILWPSENVLKQFENHAAALLIKHSSLLKNNQALLKMKEVLLSNIVTYSELEEAA